jgi:hypothetical protein
MYVALILVFTNTYVHNDVRPSVGLLVSFGFVVIRLVFTIILHIIILLSLCGASTKVLV